MRCRNRAYSDYHFYCAQLSVPLGFSDKNHEEVVNGGVEVVKEDKGEDEEAEIEGYRLQEFADSLLSPRSVAPMIHLLVESGTDIHAMNSEEYTSLGLAERYKNEVAAEALRALGLSDES